MKLSCPNCNTGIQANNINIQDKIAVCHNCDTVFQFTLSDSQDNKAKRRKVHQPKDLIVYNENRLHMSFKTNWRLLQNEAFSTGVVMGVLFTFITILMVSEGELGLLPFFTGLIALAGYYLAALQSHNQTHLVMDEHSIRTFRQPLPEFGYSQIDVGVANIESFSTEETATSKKESYGLPRYNVYANRFDGGRQIIVKDVTEEYGRYIAQALNTELAHDDTDMDTSRLTSDDMTSNDTIDYAIIGDDASNLNHRHQ